MEPSRSTVRAKRSRKCVLTRRQVEMEHRNSPILDRCRRRASRLASSLQRYVSRLAAIACSSIIFYTVSVNAAPTDTGIKAITVDAIDVNELNSLDSDAIAEKIFPDEEPVALGSS